jgi:hypothetical protein
MTPVKQSARPKRGSPQSTRSTQRNIRYKNKKLSGLCELGGERRGAVLLISMIFIVVFSALAVSMATLSSTNAQLASNQHKVDSAIAAAQSGLEVGKYLVNGYSLTSTIKTNTDITQQNRDDTWQALRTYIPNHTVAGTTWTDPVGAGKDLISSPINFGSNNEKFQVKYHYDGNKITLESTGIIPTSDGSITKKTTIDMNIKRDGEVLKYAIAGRGRMWITGDSTIHGSIFSSWKYQHLSPFNLTSDSTVEGTINTIMTKQEIANEPYQLETLDASGNPIYDASGNKVISPQDQIQGRCEGINYGQQDSAMPGMKLSDYDTTQYKNMTATIPSTTKTCTEYFPHMAGDYTQPSSSSSIKLTRYVYQNQTFTNTKLPSNKNALFKNCTFEGILYVDCGTTSSTTSFNNVRFEDCTFRGPIVTNTPTYTSSGWWQKNNLYFTGTETFQNNTTVPATILAPNFNVNLGNTNPMLGEDNVLTGAIVGGIVDVRGTAQVYGTIISMFDTSMYSSGYVTNIGATLGDGGSETTEVGDVGVISITPKEDKMLPSGITSPIVIKPLQDTYSEG